MNEEEPEVMDRATAFWTIRNQILDDMRKAFPQAWLGKADYCMELSLLAAEGVCAREARKVESGLQQLHTEIEVASRKIGAQMEQLHSNNIFAKTNGIDWELLRDYFAMKRKESGNNGEETDA
mgnify:CR=1 FL=1|tara:strand:- start:4847 stop:5215 length:369 start_codon:yes stop_codon:yes gene_type:complete